MEVRHRRLWWALGLSVALALFGAWRRQVRLRHETDKALFQAYLQGPLSDLLFAVSRSLPGLKGTDLAEAAPALRNCVSSLEALLKDKAAGPWVQSLQVVLESHRAYAVLAGRWPLKGEQAMEAYLRDEEALRLKLCDQLDTLRAEAFKEQRWRKEEWLELNALLYSLRAPREDVESVGK